MGRMSLSLEILLAIYLDVDFYAICLAGLAGSTYGGLGFSVDAFVLCDVNLFLHNDISTLDVRTLLGLHLLFQFIVLVLKQRSKSSMRSNRIIHKQLLNRNLLLIPIPIPFPFLLPFLSLLLIPLISLLRIHQNRQNIRKPNIISFPLFILLFFSRQFPHISL